MALTQQTFMGASIRSFNCQIGWNGESSTLNVDLAVDASHGDTYPTAIIGAPAYFSFLNEDATHTFRFGGIVQSFSANGGVDGLPLYATTVKSPTDILEMARIILNSYNGSVAGIPNVFNAYGYLENIDFGNAGVNQYGIPWINLLPALNYLINTNGNSDYGGQYIRFRGYNYAVDFSGLPVPPANYRIKGDNLSLLEIIQQICDDAGVDFFVRLINIGIANVIKIVTVSRAMAPSPGQISLFINQNIGVNAKSVGTELRTDETSVLLLGGQKTDLFTIQQKIFGNALGELDLLTAPTQYSVYSTGNADQRLFPTFGGPGNPLGTFTAGIWSLVIGNATQTVTFSRQPDGSIIADLGNGTRYALVAVPYLGFFCYVYIYVDLGDGIWLDVGYFNIVDEPDFIQTNILQYWGKDSAGNHQLDPRGGYINSSSWDIVGIGPDYLFDIFEIRAALSTEDMWVNTIYLKWQKYEYFLAGQLTFSSIFEEAQHKFAHDLYVNLGFEGDMKIPDLNNIPVNSLEEALNFFTSKNDWLNVDDRAAFAANLGVQDTQQNISKLYNYVRGFAEDYYGNNFLVRIPNFDVKYNGDERRYVFSHEITDTAFVDETTFVSGVITSDPSALLGMPQSMQPEFQEEDGRFVSFLRFDKLKTIDYTNLDASQYQTTNNNIYVRSQVEKDPIIIEDSGDLYSFANVKIPSRVLLVDSHETIIDAFAEFLAAFLEAKGILDANGNKILPQNIREMAFAQILKTDHFSGTHEDIAPPAVIPNGAAIPFISNVDRYGPWYNVGAFGKTRVEIDDDLVPWKFGTYELLNNTAISRVSYQATQLLLNEHGELVLPNAPKFDLGDELILGGPNITSISLSVGSDGIKTSYSLRTYTPKFKVYDKTLYDRITEMQSELNNLRSTVRQNLQEVKAIDRAQKRKDTKWLSDTATLSPSTPHTVMGATRRVLPIATNDPESRLSSAFGFGGYRSSDKTWVNDVMDTRPTVHQVANARIQEALAAMKAGFNEYAKSALVSQDAIFAPYTTATSCTGMPYFTAPTTTSAATSTSLNPFPSGHRTEFLTFGQEIPTNGIRGIESWGYEQDIRSIGFKLPFIGVGWGYDLSDNPVPADTGNPTAFASGYQWKSDIWKAGPIDLRWDAERGVWAAKTSSVDPYVVIAHSGYFYDNTLNRDARPRYIVRKIDNIQATGCGLIYTNPSVLPALVSSGTVIDRIVFNLQENYGDLHTVGLGSPVLLYNKFGQYFFNELPRTFARTDHY